MSTQVRTFTLPKPFGDALSTIPESTPAAERSLAAIPRSVPAYSEAPRVNGGGSTLPRIKPSSMASYVYDQPPAGGTNGGITYAHQEKLPKLPIPDLEKTCQKYLSVLKPLQTIREHAETKQAVEEFLRQDGPELHEKLKAYAEGRTSYIEQFCEYWCCLFYLLLIYTDSCSPRVRFVPQL